MNSNYNDIVDVILTFIDDEELRCDIAFSGSVVPYLILNKESGKVHSDFIIFVKEKKMKLVRKKIKKLSNEYDFDIMTDSLLLGGNDHGIKIQYQDTLIRLYPYSIIDNVLTIKTYTFNSDDKIVNYKTKIIPNITKNTIIRVTKFKDKNIRIISPEFIFSNMELKENNDKKTLKVLDKLIDESVLKAVRISMSKMRIEKFSKKAGNNKLIYAILALVLIIILLIAYICIKK